MNKEEYIRLMDTVQTNNQIAYAEGVYDGYSQAVEDFIETLSEIAEETGEIGYANLLHSLTDMGGNVLAYKLKLEANKALVEENGYVEHKAGFYIKP